MSRLKLIITFAIGFLFSLFLTFLKVNPIIIYLIVFFFFFAMIILPNIKPAYLSNNLQEIEAFLLKNRKKPEYQLFYGLAEHNEEDVHEAIRKLLKKPLHRQQFPIYETIQALFNEDFELAKKHIEKIKQETYKSYYRAIILIEENHFIEAEQLIQSLRKPWMVEALMVEIARKNNQHEEARTHAIKSIELAKGLQKYLLAKTFERELGKIIS